MIMSSASAAARGDLLGGVCGGGAEDKRIRFELFVVGVEPAQQRQPDRLLGRDDVAVLRAADRRDARTKIDLGMRIGF